MPPLDVLIEAPDPASTVPLHWQLYNRLREAIISGRIRPGSRLPASRQLCAELGLSRNTVLTAVQQLCAEGYLESRPGSGTYVASRLPDQLLAPLTPGARLGSSRPSTDLSRRGELLTLTSRSIAVPLRPRPFQPGIPALAELPHEIWARIGARVRRQPATDLLTYGDPRGYRPLREAVAERLRRTRAVRAVSDQVLIVQGAQQALYLTALLLLDPGDSAWVEEPCYPGMRAALLAAGIDVVPVPVDADGLDVPQGRRLREGARLAGVTPSHQSPLGVTMTLRRRLELLDWARQTGAWIMEDDYDSEYRYAGRPLAALQGLDQNERVIYVGTLSKSIFPSLRLGYLVVPAALVSAFAAAIAATSRQTPTLEQAQVAEFIAGGHMDRHVRRMRVLYEHRQQVLVAEAERQLCGLLDVPPATAGMHLLGWLPEGVDERAVTRVATRRRVSVVPLSSTYASRQPPRPGLILGYAGYSDGSIRQGVTRLRGALREVLGKSSNVQAL
jgi:GntR family transcriptional regulator/MocR family aminotransferase